MALTRVSRHIIDEPFNPTTVSATDVTTTNINASGIGTVGTLRVTGDLTVEGTTTTLDSILTEVDRLEVNANSTVAAGIITQTGGGDILNLYDGTNKEFSVENGGTVKISQSMAFQQSDRATTAGLLGRGSLLIAGTQQTDFAIRSAPHNSNLILGVGVTERLRITSGGNIGIGTDNPVSKLELWNNSNIEVLRLRDTHFNKYLTIRGGGSPNRMVIDSYEGSGGGADIDLASNGSTKVRIKSDGKVGIGTDNPTTKVHSDLGVFSSPNQSSFYGYLLSGDCTTNQGYAGYRISLENSTADFGAYFRATRYAGSTFVGLEIGTDTNNRPIRFLTGGVTDEYERLRIQPNGRIGIGTDNPQSLLSLHQSGGGFEINANSGSNNARLLSYDRPAGVHREMTFQAASYVFETSGTERLRITSNGIVNIGDSSPNADGSGALNVYSETSGALSQFVHSAGNGGLRIGGTGPGSAAHLVFSNNYNNNSWTDEFTIRMDGSDDSLRFLSGGVSGTERLRIRSDGKISAGTLLDTSSSYEFSIRGADGTGCLYAHGRNHYLSNRSTTHASLTLKKSNSDSDGIDYLQMRDSSNTAKFVVQGDGTLQVLDSIKHMGDTDTLISFPANDTITLRTNGSERLRITSTGNVGINCTPSANDLASGASFGIPKLHVLGNNSQSGAYELLARFQSGADADNSGATIVLNHTNDRGLALQGGRGSSNRSFGAIKSIDNQGRLSNVMTFIGQNGQGVDNIIFYTGNATTTTERLRVNSAGNVGIGTDVPNYRLVVEKQDNAVMLREGTGSLSGMTNNTSQKLWFQGGNAELGLFRDSSGDFQYILGTWQSTTPIPLVFRTANRIERMRVTYDGNVYIGKTSANRTDNGFAYSVGTNNDDGTLILTNARSSGGSALEINRSNSDGNAIAFYRAGTSKGTITVNSSGTTYNTTSDIRLKTDINPISDATDKLINMNPVTHKWKEDPDGDTVHGFIAQEMQNIAPEAVHGEPDGEQMMGMDYGRITPIIVAALQDAIEEINTLKQKISKLEN